MVKKYLDSLYDVTEWYMFVGSMKKRDNSLNLHL